MKHIILKKKPESCTEMVFLLDRSGSMSGLEDDTVGGFNGLLRKQREEPGTAVVTTVLFDDAYELLHDRVPIGSVRPMDRKQYYVRGCTALLDSMGRTIERVRRAHADMPPERRPDKVIFITITDGFENASREYSWTRVRELVERQKAEGWEFLFLGANLDAAATAARVGIHRDRAVRYHADHRGVAVNYNAMSKAITDFRAGVMAPEGSVGACEWKEEAEQDYSGREADARR